MLIKINPISIGFFYTHYVLLLLCGCVDVYLK